MPLNTDTLTKVIKIKPDGSVSAGQALQETDSWLRKTNKMRSKQRSQQRNPDMTLKTLQPLLIPFCLLQWTMWSQSLVAVWWSPLTSGGSGLTRSRAAITRSTWISPTGTTASSRRWMRSSRRKVKHTTFWALWHLWDKHKSYYL